ncbi:MAG: threonylcarbamoyl-AMP synthase [Bacilli bacterium]|nr:threonylcarbamoyl-AMP synthase [Bacilli bacterium]MBN2876646.1 threonylcarbamoyl-AMP synthase [Bacilli bacterium]
MIVSWQTAIHTNLNGKVIILPTDTVYGIGCLLSDIDSIHRIYDIKQRDYTKAMVILCSDLGQVQSLIESGQNIPKELAKHWPGKLTIIFFKNESVCDIITANKNTVGIRIPGNYIALELLKKHGPMVVTSLNISNEPPILKFKDTLDFENRVDLIIEGEDLDGIPSTVYDLTTDEVLRQGEIRI